MGVGRTVVIEPGETSSDVICFACSIRARGSVQGDLVSLLGGIEIEGFVSGDAVAVGGGIRLRPGAKLEGDAVAVGGPILREGSAVVEESVVSVIWFHLPGQRQFFWRGVLALAGFQFGLVAVFYPVARRRRVENIAATLARRPVWTALAGLGVVALVGLVVYGALHVELWSDALGYVLDAVLLVMAGVGALGVYAWLGRKAAPASQPFAAAVLGAALSFLLQLVPVAGFFAFLLLCLLALGVAALSGLGNFGRGANAATAR